jgi:hypothetical protein
MKLIKKPFNQLNTDELINLCYEQLNLKREDADALKFTNAFIQLIEEQLTRQLIELSTRKPERFAEASKMTDVTESSIRDLYWREKIDIVKTIDDKHFGSMIGFLRKMNDIRNKVFHAKFSELKYDGKNISDIEIQRDMVSDYIMACKV